jgi:hypothetical protein
MGGARRGRAVARCGLAPRRFTSDQPESGLQLARAAGGCIALLLEGPRAPRSACKSASCHRDSSGASVVPSCRWDSRKTTTSTAPAVAIYDPRQRGGAGRRPRGCGAFAVTRSPWGRAGATRLTPPLSMLMRERCLPRTPVRADHQHERGNLAPPDRRPHCGRGSAARRDQESRVPGRGFRRTSNKQRQRALSLQRT